MFALSHIYVSTQVVGRESPLLVFGSVLPDIAWTSSSAIGRDEIHNNPGKFYKFVQLKYAEFVDLAIGVKLHSQVGRGADFYSDGDDNNEGFTYKEGRMIEPQMAKLLKEESSGRSMVLSHNFIEAAVDLNLSESKPDLLGLYKNVVEEVDFEKISEIIGVYVDVAKKEILREVNSFVSLFSPENVLSAERLVENVVSVVIKGRFGKEIDKNEALKLLLLTKKMMADKYIGHLDSAVGKMKVDFRELKQS
jgi:hypothetical protein